MKHESIVVVYDSCEAIAEEIADKLGAETVSVQSMMIYIFIVAFEFLLAFFGVGLLIRHYNHKA